MAIQSLNPATGKVEKTFEPHTAAEIEKLLQQGEKTFQQWRKTNFTHRAELMRFCVGELSGNTEKYAQIITLEMGKPIQEARAEVKKCAAACEYYAAHAEAFLADEQIKTGATRSYIAYDPLGIILAVMPWNFPFWQVFRFAAPAIMAGNVGILKHASNVPQCALAIEEIFLKAGFPKGVFQTVLVESDGVDPLIKDDRVKAVTLTGSEGAGAHVASVAGKEIKKTVLELGGSDAFVVLKDADLETAAETAVKSRMINTGQSCIAAKRFIVEKPVAEEFIQKMKTKMAALKTGDPASEDIQYGPLARKDLAETLADQVKRSVAAGAEIVLEGGQKDKETAYFQPMILHKVKPGMPAFDEELFGPVAAVIVASDEEEALLLANNSRFGLGGSIWTQDHAKGQKLARQMESGAVFINALVASHPEMPFGGIKKSGYGRELSYIGIREFVNQKTIWLA
ncbi:NAD-dependent succinate-semialdehyde dehydrogenase [Adhaeribacter sp. BT258]|uniref:NAD-dependent succinate-semialdehyde dehydrogenase n=1 Tax=Adhaeribacter terrigena TaxID=2793070 RepID=A0ABS1C1E5_9BACT|nr:NAD-dependent succinate-semialdehyde dehydrogenase [Adhaeribacter terrigena]MBK0402438.1 NAD-dependent succinate-semialdehyde dehydrogenase [Adhaeribacter terrigena]